MSNTLKNIDVETDYSFLLEVSKEKLKELGVLDEYINRRGGNKFNDDGYDYITILQAKLIGFIKTHLDSNCNPGEVFLQWAESYFQPNNLNTEIFKEDVISEMRNFHPILESITSRILKNKLSWFCNSKGYILNPEVLRNSRGIIIRKYQGKTKEVIYIETINKLHANKLSGQQRRKSRIRTRFSFGNKCNLSKIILI